MARRRGSGDQGGPGDEGGKEVKEMKETKETKEADMALGQEGLGGPGEPGFRSGGGDLGVIIRMLKDTQRVIRLVSCLVSRGLFNTARSR